MMLDGEKKPPLLESELNSGAQHPHVSHHASGPRLEALRRRDARERISPRKTSGPASLSFAQERLWFFDQLVPGCPAYNSFRALRLTGQLDVAVLQRTLDALMLRHEALRTTFSLADSYPTQIVNPADSASLVTEDLSMLSADEQATTLTERVVEAARRPFDLARDPLLRSVLLRLNEQEHVLVLVIHHIAFDAWSGTVLLREFMALYDAFVDGTGGAFR